MYLRDLRSCLVFLLLLPAAAQEPLVILSSPAASTVRFRTASLGHDILLRDTPQVIAPAKFSLPPGGLELELQPTSYTPYDRYFGSVREVISSLEPEATTMATACHLMKVGYSFRYITRDPYRPDPPKLTEAQRAGDCKSKALWLYDKLADSGALFAIGKAEKNSRTSHAWVYWRNGGRWWILDCTDRLNPIAADTVSSDRYVPYYSYGKSGVYRHPSTQTSKPTDDALAAAVASPDRKKLR